MKRNIFSTLIKNLDLGRSRDLLEKRSPDPWSENPEEYFCTFWENFGKFPVSGNHRRPPAWRFLAPTMTPLKFPIEHSTGIWKILERERAS